MITRPDRARSNKEKGVDHATPEYTPVLHSGDCVTGCHAGLQRRSIAGSESTRSNVLTPVWHYLPADLASTASLGLPPGPTGPAPNKRYYQLFSTVRSAEPKPA